MSVSYTHLAAHSAWRHRGAPDVQDEQLHLEDHPGDDAVRLDLRGTNRARRGDGSQEPRIQHLSLIHI